MISKEELAAMIAALESQPHLSIKEEKYLAVMKELVANRRENIKLWGWVGEAEQRCKKLSR